MTYDKFIKSVLQESSIIAKKYFQNTLEIDKAGDNNQVLTQADLEIGNYIINRIKVEFPDYNIIDEEAGIINNNSEFTFVVDPIDGTSNFSNGLPHYGIMIGLLHNNVSIAGGAVLPYFNELYYAEKGEGAWLNDKKINVTNQMDFSKTLGCYWIDGFKDNPERTFKDCKKLADYALELRNVRISNSVYDICKLAEGKYSIVVCTSSKIWDNVPLQIIVEEAGGVFWNENGIRSIYKNPYDTNKNYNFFAFAKQFETKIIEINKK